MSLLNEPITLELNAHWQVIHVITPKTAFVDMSKDTVRALNIVSAEEFYPVTWDEWLQLPPVNSDLVIQSAKRLIRVPTVVIAVNCEERPHMKAPSLTIENVAKRDGYKDAYTGETIPKSEWSLDHVMPQSRGGQDTWENLVLCSKKVNQLKDDRTPEEAGLTLRIKPYAPRVLPAFMHIRNRHRIPDWDLFLGRGKN